MFSSKVISEEFEIIFYFQHFIRVCFYFLGKKLEGHEPPRPLPLLRHWISNDNRTEWSPIRSVLIRVITKSDDRAAGVRFVNHEYDYRPNWMTRILITNES